MSIFNFVVNENNFSVLVEHYRFLKLHDIALHVSLHWHPKCHYEKLEHVILMITWSGNINIDKKAISGLTHFM